MLLKLLRNLGQLTKRTTVTRQDAVSLQPHSAAGTDPSSDPLLERGRALLAQNDLPGARIALEQALELGVQESRVLILLATVYAQQGDLGRAHDRIDAALDLSPNDPYAHNTLGNLLRLEGKLEEAVESYRRAIASEPHLASALSNCALCLQDLGQFESARTSYVRAIEADPSNPTVACNLAGLLFDLGEFDDALRRIDAVLRTHPQLAQAHAAKGLGLLRRGHFAEGWPEYEWREHENARSASIASAYPEWNGLPMPHGSLLVCAEQGLGDQIMFASCLGNLRALVAHCVVECDPRLKPLLARAFPETHIYAQRNETVQPWLEDGIVPAAQTRIGSLPLRFRRRIEDFPGRSYLQSDPAKTAAWVQRLKGLGPGLKLGISWRGGVPTTRRATRSIALRDWAPILRLPSVHIISLQYGDCDEEIADAMQTCGAHITHWPTAITDYDETAALVCGLDIVVSVQTSVVHLAGALGKPTWVLVPRIAEWRYGETEETMPWYPSVRLCRQRSGNGWSEVIERIRMELSQLIADTRRART